MVKELRFGQWICPSDGATGQKFGDRFWGDFGKEYRPTPEDVIDGLINDSVSYDEWHDKIKDLNPQVVSDTLGGLSSMDVYFLETFNEGKFKYVYFQYTSTEAHPGVLRFFMHDDKASDEDKRFLQEIYGHGVPGIVHRETVYQPIEHTRQGRPLMSFYKIGSQWHRVFKQSVFSYEIPVSEEGHRYHAKDILGNDMYFTWNPDHQGQNKGTGTITEYSSSKEESGSVYNALILANGLQFLIRYHDSHQLPQRVLNLVAKVPINNYHYNTDSWGECSQACGGGVQSRDVSCVDGQVIVSDNLCIGYKPPASQPCNTDACPAEYRISYDEWGACSATCGTGMQERVHRCVKQSDNSEVQMIHCDNAKLDRLVMQECTKDPCVYRPSEWSDCQVECGETDGKRTRTVECSDGKVNVNIALCNEIMPKPLDTQSCTIQEPVPCNTWTKGKWGECSVPCGEGTRTQTYTCISNGEEVDEELCTQEKPDVKETCTAPCECKANDLADGTYNIKVDDKYASVKDGKFYISADEPRHGWEISSGPDNAVKVMMRSIFKDYSLAVNNGKISVTQGDGTVYINKEGDKYHVFGTDTCIKDVDTKTLEFQSTEGGFWHDYSKLWDLGASKGITIGVPIGVVIFGGVIIWLLLRSARKKRAKALSKDKFLQREVDRAAPFMHAAQLHNQGQPSDRQGDYSQNETQQEFAQQLMRKHGL